MGQQTKLKFFKVMTLPVLLYGSGNLTLSDPDKEPTEEKRNSLNEISAQCGRMFLPINKKKSDISE